MKKISSVAAKQRKNFCEQKLTIGLDLGDRWSWYCLLGEAGEVLQEQKLGTTPKAMKEVFGGMPRSRIALEMGMHSPWVSRVLSELGHEVIVAHARNVRLIGESRRCLGIDRWLCFFRMTFCGICHPCGLVAHPPQRTRKGGAPFFLCDLEWCFEWVGRAQRSSLGILGFAKDPAASGWRLMWSSRYAGEGGRATEVLLLEEILEGGARIHGPGGGWRRGFLFYANSHGKECAFIALILARDSLGDGLGAFEAAGSIEVRTLAAGVEFKAALRAFPNRLGDRSQQRAALRAAGNGMRSRHLQCAGSEGFFLDRLVAGWLWPVFIPTSFSVAVLIAVLTILL
jgi:hypothetical protein